MPSFGVSTTSPKKSSSFNMSPTSAIIFIKCRNRHHTKNNNHFFNWRTKTPSNVTLLGRTSSEVFVMLVVVVHSFCCCCYSFIASYVMLFFIHCFSASSLNLPWTITRFLHPFYTFKPAHRRVIRGSDSTRDLLSQFYRERYGFEWAFFTHRRFLPYAPSPTFLPAFIKAFLGAGSSSLKFAGLHTDPRNTDPAHLFV